MNRKSTERRYWPEIDGLRAVSVLAIILHHFDTKLLPGGYLGVDIFFVISGFVITSSLAAHPAEKGLGNLLLRFYARRVRRLLPALVVCVLITSLLACLFDPRAGVSLRTGITALLGFSNFNLLSPLHRLLRPFRPAECLHPHLVAGGGGAVLPGVPFLLWTTGFALARPKGRRRVFRLVAVISLFSLLCFLALSVRRPMDAFFLMPARFWELGCGCLLHVVLSSRGVVSAHGPSSHRLATAWRAASSLPGSLLLGLVLATLLLMPPGAMVVGAPAHRAADLPADRRHQLGTTGRGGRPPLPPQGRGDRIALLFALSLALARAVPQSPDDRSAVVDGADPDRPDDPSRHGLLPLG
jgi:peptidoglycan/LPS O-acetylase OafA/YrhL